MASKLGRSQSQKTFQSFTGGLLTRPDSEVIEQAMKNGKLYAIETANIELYKTGALKNSTGWTANSNRPDASSEWMTQAVSNGFGSVSTATNNYVTYYFRITPGSTRKSHVLSVLNILYMPSSDVTAYIYSDSAGVPNTLLTTSNSLIVRLETGNAGSLSFTQRFIFNAPVTLTSGTPYWIAIKLTRTQNDGLYVSGTIQNQYSVDTSLTTAANVKIDPGTGVLANAGASGFPYYVLESATVAIQGFWDIRSEASGTIGQDIVALQGGALYPMTTPSAPTTSGWDAALTSGLGSGQDALGDHAVLNNVHYFTDYSNNIGRAWNASASYTIQQGWRATLTIGQTATGAGGPWSAAGVVKVMGLTLLTSGGYRTTELKSITLTGNQYRIDLSAITNGATGATDFGFDVTTLNTTWFCTLPNGAVYYKIPVAYISGAGGTNPPTNATNFAILPMTDAQLIAGGTIDFNIQIPQAAFTLQVNTPKFKFMEVFANCVVGAGDPDNPSRVWISWQGGPGIWSSYQGVYGLYIDVDPENGQIITGLKVSDGRLYIGKNASLYFIDYTGDNNAPFSNPRKVHGQEGVQSHWTMQIIPQGLWFVSSGGPAICYGTYSNLDPAFQGLLNLFDAGDPSRFNVTTMAFSTSANYEDRNQIWTTIASSSTATLRDKFLVYDYEMGQYWICEDQPSNIVTMIGDANGNLRLFSASYYGKITRKNIESDTSPYLNDGGVSFFLFEVPNLSFGDLAGWKEGGYLEVGGKGSAFYIDFYREDSDTIYCTSVISPTVTTGYSLYVQIPFSFKSMRIRLRTVAAAGSVQIDWLRFEFTDQGVRR